MTLMLLLSSAVFFAVAYRYFGSFLTRKFALDDSRPVPAETEKDGIDFVPTRASIVFGHHFSSIAGAGPIVGPVLACLYFGWGPTWIWILIGAAFIGGLHDFGSGYLSVRSKGRSVAEVMRDLLGRKIGALFAVFILMALIYVVIVFLDLTASTFTSTPEVATASGWFVIVALIFGQIVTRAKNLPFWANVVVFVPLSFAGLAVGYFFPAGGVDKSTWILAISIYCFIAAVLPVNVLLQPRDFLSASFLYAMMLLGLAGLLFAHAPMQEQFFKGWTSEAGAPIVPILFITVACGACSGFHSMVASGTTSKQVCCETDLKRVTYGAMLIEGLLAVFALCCIGVLSAEQIKGAGQPVAIFATGAAEFLGTLGISGNFAKQFTLLAVSTFLLTTLDTCTRLSRFLIEEIFSKRNQITRYVGTAFIVLVAGGLSFQPIDGQPVWKAIWPLFGSTNQLLAAMALIAVVLFLRRAKNDYQFAIIPALIMFVMPVLSMYILFQQNGIHSIVGACALVQLILAIVLAITVFLSLRTQAPEAASAT